MFTPTDNTNQQYSYAYGADPAADEHHEVSTSDSDILLHSQDDDTISDLLNSHTASSSSSSTHPYASAKDHRPDAKTFLGVRITSTMRIVMLSCCAALGGFLSGYDTGIISGATLYIQEDFALLDWQTELVVSGVIGGAILGGLAAGGMTDRFGRKPVIIVASAVFVLGALMMAIAPNWIFLLLGRVVAGAAVGSGSAVPVYIAELAPPHIRGALVNLNAFFIALGQLISYLIAYGLSESGNWRLMLGLAALPAALQFGAMFFMPASPRYLVQIGKPREAYHVLRKVRSGKATRHELEQEVESIKQSLQNVVENVPWFDMWRKADYRKPLIIAVGLQVLQQFSGINTIMYYSATILRKAHFPSKSSAILFSSFIALANVFGSCTAMSLIDRSGRRKLLLITMVGVVLGLSVLSASFQALEATTEKEEGDTSIGFASWSALCSLVSYVYCYAVGLGCVPWLLLSELFPLEIRGKGAGLSIAANWTTNFIISITFLSLTSSVGPASVFAFFAGVVCVGWIMVYAFVPETKGQRLEDIGGAPVFVGH
ncbi:general substrate transporter [Gaertneriomyces semiglobifer]|nr:general substrate transporter [Gaertneriomyces semiglobifer]